MSTYLELETKINNKPAIDTQKTDGADVGRITIPVIKPVLWQPSHVFLQCLNALNGINQPGVKAPEDLRRNIVFSLNHNAPYANGPINHKRAVSTYFTDNSSDKEIIIEWGTIDPDNESAKLHDYLNRKINYWERYHQGMKLSSGHIARVTTEVEEIYLALIDNLPSIEMKIVPYEPMGRLINALHSANFIPIGGDGFVRLPAF